MRRGSVSARLAIIFAAALALCLIAPACYRPSAAAMPAGGIYGRVTDETTGTGIGGCPVHAYTPEDPKKEVKQVTTVKEGDNIGYYKINLEPGYYKIFFDPPDESYYLKEWYQQKPDWQYAETVEVVNNQYTTGIDGTLVQGAGISGRVTGDDTGEGIDGCTVYAYDPRIEVWYTTDTESWGGQPGYYYLRDLPEKTLYVKFDPGDGDDHLPEWYNDKQDPIYADKVKTTQGINKLDIDASLALGGSICGTVTEIHEEGEEGDPINDCWVYAYDAATGEYFGWTSTYHSGRYTLTGLPSGSGLPGGDYKVAFAPGDGKHLPQWYDDKPDQGGADPVTVGENQKTCGIEAELATGASISGKVTDKADKAINDCLVEVFEYVTGHFTGTATSDRFGDYYISGLPAGSYKVFARPGDGINLSVWYNGERTKEAAHRVVLDPGEAKTGVDFIVPLGGSITGTVTDQVTGTVLSGCEVSAYDATTGKIWFQGDTDENGLYSLTGLPGGAYKVEVVPYDKDKIHVLEWYKDKISKDLADHVPVVEGFITPKIDVDLPVGGSISGKVTDKESDLPIVGCYVSCYEAETGKYIAGTTTSDEIEKEGTYSFTGLAGEYIVEFAPSPYDKDHVGQWFDGKATQDHADRVSVGVRDVPDINAALARSGKISGTVTEWEKGSGGKTKIRDCIVRAYAYDYSNESIGELRGESTTDGYGRFTIGNLPTDRPDGSYRVEFAPPKEHLAEWYHDKQIWQDADKVLVTAGGTTTCDEDLYPLTGSISGTVTETGSGGEVKVSNCPVSAYRFGGSYPVSSTVSSDSGGYKIDLPQGKYQVEFAPEDGKHMLEWFDDKQNQDDANEVIVTAGRITTCNADLVPTKGSISGTVTEAGTGGQVKLKDCPVNAFDAVTGAWIKGASTGRYGEYTISDLPALPSASYKVQFAPEDGKHLLEWYHDRPDQDDADTVEVTGGRDTRVDEDLTVLAAISGTVTGVEGGPLAGCWVYAYDTAGGDRPASAVTGDSGEYKLTCLPAESGRSYLVQFVPTDGAHLPEWYDNRSGKETADPVAVTAGGTTSGIDAALPVGGVVSGTVTENGTGKTVSGCRVSCYDATTGEPASADTTNESGGYALRGLPGGSYKVEFAPDDGIHGPEWYDERPNRDAADAVAVGVGGTVTGIDAALSAGSISGMVTDEVTKNPVGGCPVYAYEEKTGSVASETKTSSAGDYTLGGLPTGTFKVRFAPADGVHIPEWYQNKVDQQGADPVGVSAPNDRPGVNAGLAVHHPLVVTCSPDSGRQGQTLDVCVTGRDTNFSDRVSKAVFGGNGVTVNSTKVTSATQATANITVARDAAPGNRDVNVTTGKENPDPLAGGFAVTSAVPRVAGVVPASGPPGTEVTITGSGFGGSRKPGTGGGTLSVVRFGGVEAAGYSMWSDAEIRATVAEGTATGPVTVETHSGSSNANRTFVVEEPPRASTERPIWYLPEGSTAWGYQCYITVMNPNPSAVTAKITYMTASGPKERPDINMPGLSQMTVNPRDDLGEADFSTKVECREGKTIAVDRTMTWVGVGATSPEGHSSMGVPGPEKTWYLPEGSSNWGFECFLLIQNPNDAPATCRVTYMIENEGPQTFTKAIPANSRQTFNMAADIGQKDASIKVDSDIPVIPERAMYRNGRREGHGSIGATSPAFDFYLAEGTTGWGYTTYVLVQNPNDTDVEVTITYMTPEGARPQPTFNMAANSRKTLRVNDVLANTDVSAVVHGSKPLIAERAMYWDAGQGEACHDSIGVAEPHSTFYFPDGQTSEGRETFTLVQNPNATDVRIEVWYLAESGIGSAVFTDTIPANSRKTYNMADKGIDGRAAVMVTSGSSGKKIVAERAMYWNNRGAGTDTIGGYSD